MWKPIHNIDTEKTTLRIVYFYYAPFFIQTLMNVKQTNKQTKASVLLWTMQCGRIDSERYGSRDDHIQFHHKILITKFWKRSLRSRKFYYILHNQVQRGTQLCLPFSGWGMQGRLIRVWNISLGAKGGQMERWPLPGLAVGTSFCSLCCGPGQAETGAWCLKF